MISFKQHLFEIALVSRPSGDDMGSHKKRIESALQSIMNAPYIHTDHVTGKKYKFDQFSDAMGSYAGSVQSKFHSKVDPQKHTDKDIIRLGNEAEQHYEPFLNGLHMHYATQASKHVFNNPEVMTSLQKYARHSGVHPEQILSHAFEDFLDGIHSQVTHKIGMVNSTFSSPSQINSQHGAFHAHSEQKHGSPMGSIYEGGMHPESRPKEIK